MRQRESPRNKQNGTGPVTGGQNGESQSPESKPTESSPTNATTTEQRKLRNRDSIAKPDTLQYEPSFTKGVHAKLMQSIMKESINSSNSSSKISPKNGSKGISHETTPSSPPRNKRKSVDTPIAKDKHPASTAAATKKAKAEWGAYDDYFDSYAFSLKLINTEDDIIKEEKVNSPTEKNVLVIRNLPSDVTREMLVEHFRKTGGIKSVRIPKTKAGGVAYMEFGGRIGLGIALRLHETTLGGNKISVDFVSSPPPAQKK